MQRTPLWSEWSVHHIATHRDGSILGRVAVFARGVLSFCTTLLVRRPDVVHLHTASYGSFARKSALAALARLARVPVVLHVHGGAFQSFHDHAPRRVQRVIRQTLTRSAAVIALDAGWAERLRRIAPEARIVVVPNPIAPVGRTIRTVPHGQVHVVHLGLISDGKGTFTLLDAWAKVLAGSARPAHLTIAGNGEFSRAERRIAELGLVDTVALRHWLSSSEVAELLASAHVLTLPSRAEGQPMVVLEAMANGLCVVASEVGGIPDMLAGGCGVLVPPDDPEALAAALGAVLNDPGERIRMGDRALERVRREFDPEVVWRRLDALYREVVQR
jgi:glycosyltransferase involved in cell wall biosynthesis